MKDNIKILTEYLDRNEISYTIDNNPSPEKIEKIKSSIKRRENLEKILVERYKKEN